MTLRSDGFNRTQEICAPSYLIFYCFMRFLGKVGHTVDLRPQYPAHLRNPISATATLHIICIFIDWRVFVLCSAACPGGCGNHEVCNDGTCECASGYMRNGANGNCVQGTWIQSNKYVTQSNVNPLPSVIPKTNKRVPSLYSLVILSYMLTRECIFHLFRCCYLTVCTPSCGQNQACVNGTCVCVDGFVFQGQNCVRGKTRLQLDLFNSKINMVHCFKMHHYYRPQTKFGAR